jgi:hypothetical protein
MTRRFDCKLKMLPAEDVLTGFQNSESNALSGCDETTTPAATDIRRRAART